MSRKAARFQCPPRRSLLVTSIVVAPLAVAILIVAIRSAQISYRKVFSPPDRIPWTTSHIHGTPSPPPPYTTRNAFPQLVFDHPVALECCAGSNQWIVAEEGGKVFSFENSKSAVSRQLVLDLNQKSASIFGLALHPKFLDNGYIFVAYSTGFGGQVRVSRFHIRTKLPYDADLHSESEIIDWPHTGHPGGCLQFGPDGYLYISVGDGSVANDELNTGQDVSDLFGSILRIDIDHVQPDKPYQIPDDNPFLGMPRARPEIWAFGVRHVWKMSFDLASSDLWAGDVGQDLWETVYIVKRGSNHGWSVLEGNHSFRPHRQRHDVPITQPLIEHTHTEMRSVTGGHFYRGSRFPELRNSYIYGGYDTGNIWCCQQQDGEVTSHRMIADTPLRISAFGLDKHGELYIVDHVAGTIHELVHRPFPKMPHQSFPRKLSQTGLFSSVKDHQVALGVTPYSVNAKLWSDRASKERFLAIPGHGKIDFDTIVYPQADPLIGDVGWGLPNGTVVMKTFSLEMERGNPQSVRRIETRILHLESLAASGSHWYAGNQDWHGYSYMWNESQTDAELVEPQGTDRTYRINGTGSNSGTQVWHFPSRSECTSCHTQAAKFLLGLNTLQMNGNRIYRDGIENQLRHFERAGYFENWLPKGPEKLPALVDPADTRQSLTDRARSYLHVNCAHCHRKCGGGNSDIDLRFGIPLDAMKVVKQRPMHGSFGIGGAALVEPGHPERSILYHRITSLGPERMPKIGTTVIDEQGTRLIFKWIKQMGHPNTDQ